jgi:hypothetical protein
VDVKDVARTLALVPPTIFHRDYLPPHRDDTPLVNVLLNEKYPLPIILVTNNISSEKKFSGRWPT